MQLVNVVDPSEMETPVVSTPVRTGAAKRAEDAGKKAGDMVKGIKEMDLQPVKAAGKGAGWLGEQAGSVGGIVYLFGRGFLKGVRGTVAAVDADTTEDE